jgi:nicotinate-nucleotide adenylyltransferase
MQSQEAKRPRLGVYGGSFDPPHLGHLHVLRAALEHGGLDRCLVVPAARSPFKPTGPALDDAARLELARAAFDDFEHVEVDARELERPPPSYTIDTLRELAAEAPGAQLVLVVGSDNLPDLPRWREGRAILELAEPLIVPRGEDRDATLERAGNGLDAAARARLARGWLPVPAVPTSSTDLRARLARRDASALAELPPRVGRLVVERGWYGWGS